MMGLDARRLVFIDETWPNTSFTRLRGRAPRGQRLIDKVPLGHWVSMTFVAALRVDGLSAPMVLEGAMDGRTMRSCKTLRPGGRKACSYDVR